MPVAWPSTLPLPLLAVDYGRVPRSALTVMETGRLRNRRAYDEPIEVLTGTWHFTQGQFSAFKEFFEVSLVNGQETFTFTLVDPDDLSETTYTMGFLGEGYSFSRTDNLFEVTAQLEVAGLQLQASPSLCAVELDAGVEGGGDKFDCYSESEDVTSLFNAGTGFSGTWIIADSPFGTILGDNFDSYDAEASPIQQSMTAGTGFTGAWIHGDA